MAFPGTYNFNYYKGDTFEFKIYPKNTNGSAFDLTTFNEASFSIATARGAAGVNTDRVDALASISLSDNSITCTITPSAGNELDADRDYVYDVEISKGSGTSAVNYTLLTGSVSITDQVSGATA
jgi:hypothetical protein